MTERFDGSKNNMPTTKQDTGKRKKGTVHTPTISNVRRRKIEEEAVKQELHARPCLATL
ncbi:Uncharacterized protein APZ42_016478 [Daphnia magna]|uniref:Uncharacterized protein n=1 Tax=Daphnia magna TaxID=35525 RepID=A0A165AFA7_9CRUS|nr:Uncharacterized protein APZ42_016478 [Daphnia magna]